VPKAIAPRMSIIKLIQKSWITLKGICPRDNALKMTTATKVMLIVS
jgi:hypothetical protein